MANSVERQGRAARRKILAHALELTYDSLRSHLSDAVKCHRQPNNGNEEWHARCVREYATTIYALGVELHELTKIDFAEKFFTSRRKKS